MAIQRRLVEAVEVTENRVHVIRLKNIFDASTVNEFEKVISYLLARNFYKIVVDLGHVEFISSAGWGTFKAELRRVRGNQGDVKLANMSPDICDVFLLLELDSFIQAFDTVDEALAAFSQPVVAPDPGLMRPSIVQEIKAASHVREMSESGTRVAEKPVSESAVGAPGDIDGAGALYEYTTDHFAYSGERKVTAPSEGESFGGQSEYVVGSSAAEAEYGESSHSTYDQYATAEQTEYAGEGEYESSSADSYDDGLTEQAEYAGDVYADETEYEDSSAESYGDDGTVEQAEYASDVYADENEYEGPSVEPGDEQAAAEEVEYAGDGYVDENEYENSSVKSDNEHGAAEPADRGVKAQNNYAIAGDGGENGLDHLTLPAPAASGPEMWELILTGGKAPVDPYMFKESARMFPEEEKPQQFFASGATKPFSSRPDEEDSLPGSESETSAPRSSSDADNAFEEFVELGAAPDFSFAGHEPFVDDNSRTETDSASASAEAGFEHAPIKSSPDGDDEFDEFETQDIRDPWILDEIDTLPEEYEMEEGTTDEEPSSFAATEILSYDLEIDESFSSFPDQARDYDKGGTDSELPTHFETLSQTGADDSFDNLRDLPTHGAEEEAQAESDFRRQAEAHAALPDDDLQGNFSAPSLPGENFDTPRNDSFDPPAKSKRKRTAQTKKNKPKMKRAKTRRSTKAKASITPPALDEHAELITRTSVLPSPSSQNGNEEVNHGFSPDGALPKIPASDNLEEIVRAVVATHPHFGPAMICKFIKDRFEPPVLIGRSTVYRFLREADLNTREKRQKYADQVFDSPALTEEI